MRRIVLAASLLACSPAPEPIKPAVLLSSKIDGQPPIAISKAELEYELARAKLEQQGGEPRALAPALVNALVERMIDDAILIEEGRRLGVEASTVAVEAMLLAMKDGYTPNAFERQLLDRYLTEDEVRRSLAEENIRTQVLRQTTGAATAVTDAEAHRIYTEAHDTERWRPSRIRVSQIVVRTERVATRLFRQMRYDSSRFGELAEQHSIGAESTQGGDLGWFEAGSVGGLIQDVCFALELGRVSRPRSSGQGFHLFKVTDREEARLLGFEEAKPRIVDRLARERARTAKQLYLAKLRGQYRIEKHLDVVGPLE